MSIAPDKPTNEQLQELTTIKLGMASSRPTPVCPYCNRPSLLVKGDIIYPHRRDLFHKYFYLCHTCDAYVGCHPGTQNALGRLADKPLRLAKARVHALLDPLWKTQGMTRSAAYRSLAQRMGIDAKGCHVGQFTLEQCELAERVLQGQ